MCPKKITNLKALYPPMKPKYYMIHFTIITVKLLFLLSTNVISLSINTERTKNGNLFCCILFSAFKKCQSRNYNFIMNFTTENESSLNVLLF